MAYLWWIAQPKDSETINLKLDKKLSSSKSLQSQITIWALTENNIFFRRNSSEYIKTRKKDANWTSEHTVYEHDSVVTIRGASWPYELRRTGRSFSGY